MVDTATSPLVTAGEPVEVGEPVERDAPLVEEELLVEDVSIDGMCGVY